MKALLIVVKTLHMFITKGGLMFRQPTLKLHSSAQLNVSATHMAGFVGKRGSKLTRPRAVLLKPSAENNRLSDSGKAEREADSLVQLSMHPSLVNIYLRETCSGCGALFQHSAPSKPGFLAPSLLLSKLSSSLKNSKAPSSVHTRSVAAVPTSHLSADDELSEGLSLPDLNRILKQRRAVTASSAIVCKYCHNLKHYNSATLPTRPDTEKLIGKHMREHPRAVVVLVVDAADLPASLVGRGIDQLRERHVVVAVNKIDLIVEARKSGGQREHRSMSGGGEHEFVQSEHRFVKYVQRIVQKELRADNVRMGAAVRQEVPLAFERPDDDRVPVDEDSANLDMGSSSPTSSINIVPVSAKTGFGMMDLVDKVNSLREPGDHVYFIGRPNAGKSQLIQTISDFANSGGDASKKPTSSVLPGTTVGINSRALSAFGTLFDATEFSLGDGSNAEEEIERRKESGLLFDTPGIFGAHQITPLLTPRELQLVVPTKPLRAQAIQLGSGRSLFVGGMMRIDVHVPEGNVDDTAIQAVAFVSGGVPLHACRTARAGELWERHVGVNPQMMYPPLGDGKRLGDLVSMRRVPAPAAVGRAVDVVLGGVGWVRVEGLKRGSYVEVWCVDKGRGAVSIRDSWF